MSLNKKSLNIKSVPKLKAYFQEKEKTQLWRKKTNRCHQITVKKLRKKMRRKINPKNEYFNNIQLYFNLKN